MNKYEFILETLKKAGEILLEEKNKKFEVIWKDNNPQNVVTEVDFIVNNFIIGEIKKHFPGDLIYSEEIKNTILDEKNFWTIDPIDGSSNFAAGIPFFSICIGYVENLQSTVGGIFNPMTDELFSFKKGGGAFLNGKKISISDKTDLKYAMVNLRSGSRRENWDWGTATYRKLLENANRMVSFGSSALDCAYVACGRYEATIYGTMTSFDVSCAIGLVLEAGGVVVGSDYQPLEMSFEKGKVFVANNSKILEQLKAIDV